MAKKQKYYVVWNGHQPGIYLTWDQCLRQTKNYPGALYKAYNSREEAENAYLGGPEGEFSKGGTKKALMPPDSVKQKLKLPGWAVDAACSGNPGLMEYRGVDLETNAELFRQGPFAEGTNNIGEFLAIVHALALLKRENKSSHSIYTDSATAIGWVKKKKCNTKVKSTPKNASWLPMIKRAENWLKNNTWNNPIIKWETEVWGEIPADFGRK